MSHSTFTNGSMDKAKWNIRQSLQKFITAFETWNDMLENTNTAATNVQFQSLTDSLKAQYKEINRSLKQLSKRISAENDGNKSDMEFVKNVKIKITECRTQIQSERTKKIMNQHRREYEASLDVSHRKRMSKLRNYGKDRNDLMIEQQKEMLQMEREEQDEILEDMHSTLKRLGVHANTINIEIDSQIQSLNEIGDDMDYTKNKLDRLANKMDDLMKHSNSKKRCLIFILIIILIFMIYLIA